MIHNGHDRTWHLLDSTWLDFDVSSVMVDLNVMESHCRSGRRDLTWIRLAGPGHLRGETCFFVCDSHPTWYENILKLDTSRYCMTYNGLTLSILKLKLSKQCADLSLHTCEAHVRSFTKNKDSGVKQSHAGTFLGFIVPCCWLGLGRIVVACRGLSAFSAKEKIPHLLNLGINCVELRSAMLVTNGGD